MFKRLVFGLMLASLLAGCASMSETECRVADWARVGFNDGARGEPERRLAAYTEDCGEIGITPEPQAYRQGWDAGIQRYCTAANGWRAGLDGQSSKDQVCAGQIDHPAFSHYLHAGLQVYTTQQRMDNNVRELKRLQKKLDEATSDEDKRQLRRQMQTIDLDQHRLRGQLGLQRLQAP